MTIIFGEKLFNMATKFILTIFLNIIFFCSNAQTIKGNIYSSNGSAIAFVNIFVPELSIGTTSDENGYYEINVPKGTYKILYRYMGYGTQERSVIIAEKPQQLDIVLLEQAILIDELKVLSSGEDPAYYVMRHAISMAPYYKKQIGTYDCKAYVKGSGHMYKIPRIFRKKIEKEGIKLNKTYSSESISKIHFEQPNKITQKVEAVRTSVLDESFNSITMPMLSINLYENWDISADNYNTSVISPLDKNAFAVYRYKLLGTFYDQDYLINKIQVTPKVGGKNKFEGIICIVENLWNIHSADLKFSVPFANIKMKQIYSLIDNNVWMPTSQELNVDGGAVGFAGIANYVASFLDYKIELNKYVNHSLFNEINEEQASKSKVSEILSKTQETNSRSAQVIKELQQNSELNNSEMRKLQRNVIRETKKLTPPSPLEIKEPYILIKADANNDSSFWNKIRPTPLTDNETKSFADRDIIAKDYTPKQKNDSSKIKPRNFNIKPHLISYNTVDGLKPGLSLNFNKIDTLGQKITGRTSAFYGFASKNIYGDLSLEYTWNGIKHRGITFEFGRNSTDFKTSKAYDYISNTIYTLLFENNNQKFYDNTFAKIGFFTDLSNGLVLSTSIDYSNRESLKNNSNWKIVNWNNRDFTENIIVLPDTKMWQYSNNTNTNISVSLSYTPKQYYRIHNNYKYSEHSKYPTMWILYNKALDNIFKSEANYDFLQAGLKHKLNIGTNDVLRYTISGGIFINDKDLYLHDFYFTQANNEYLDFNTSINQFNATSYYQLFSKKHFFELHSWLNSDKIILKRLPLINKTLMNETIRFHLFTSETISNYVEVGYGIGNAIFNISANYGIENCFSKSFYDYINFKLTLSL